MSAAVIPPALTPRDARDVAEVVRESATLGRTLRIVGGASWLDAGRPVSASATLDLHALSGIVEYVPGDLTLTARAATPIAELQRLTRERGQWLPLDPIGNSRATLGATLATAAYGALSATVGRPRDVTLGLELVTGEGRAIRGGGRVVKNVAGFDLVRLNVGAWGTLGIITEATVRLRALPAVDVTFALAAAPTTPALAAQLRTLREAAIAPMAMELVNAAVTARLGGGATSVLLVRISGNEESVQAQRELLQSLGDTREVGPEIWDELRAIDPAKSATLRVSRRPSELANLWHATEAALHDHPDARLHANVDRGVVRIVLPDVLSADLRALVSQVARGGTVVGERLSATTWSSLGTRFGEQIAVAARRAYDPASILNPGIVAPL